MRKRDSEQFTSDTILPADFYCGGTVSVARALIGACLVYNSKEGMTAGRIVETEAYLYKTDPASHAYRGQTPRNGAMFGPPGHAYIYLIYGMYLCFNVVTAPVGDGQAVLIRALEPLAGIELMKVRRKTDDIGRLCSGPGKLVQAMGIRREQSGVSLIAGDLTLHAPRAYRGATEFKIAVSRRIGITAGAELPLRFCLKGSRYLSAKE